MNEASGAGATRTKAIRLWHPFADMGQVQGHELVLERGEGVWLWDSEGRRYLDATSSLWYSNIGHGRERMISAISAQLHKLDAYSIFGDHTNRPALELAERLAGLAPVPDARVFLTTGGGDGIETAAKLSRFYFDAIGQPQRTHVIGRTEGFHGVFGFGTAIGGIQANRSGFGHLMEDASLVPYDSVEALEREIQHIGNERVAAFFCEPVMGAGGVLLPPEGYIRGVAEVCRRHGVLFVCDSVICGFGRLGTWYGIERFGVVPDMIVFAKGVSSGYLPVGGVVVAGAIADPLWSPDVGRAFRQGTTYAGHPTCCAAALANLDILEEEGLLQRSRELEAVLDAALRPAIDHPLVEEVRSGLGFLGAVELDAKLLRQNPRAVLELGLEMRARGVMVRALGSAIAVSPPLVAEPEHVDLIAEALMGALDACSTPAGRLA
jgi:putrescine aminotransferase